MTKESKVKLLTISSEYESAKTLGFYSIVTRSYEEIKATDIVIRWGNSGLFYQPNKNSSRLHDYPNVLNPSAAIRANCQKLDALKKMSKVVKTPIIYEREVTDKVKVVVRPYEHDSGRDFTIKEGPFKLDDGYYGTEFIDTDEEYRVWFCNNNTFCALRVPLENDDPESKCRSNFGYRYTPIPTHQLKLDVLAAAKTIGLEFGAADLLCSKGNYYFLELNSAPSIDTGRVRSFFQNNLQDLIATKFPDKACNV